MKLNKKIKDFKTSKLFPLLLLVITFLPLILLTSYDGGGLEYETNESEKNNRVISDGNSWVENGNVISSLSDDQKDPQLISDGVGGAIITWEDQRGGGGYHIYAQRINSDGGVQWTTNGIAITSITNGYNPVITSDGSGGAIIAWQGGAGIDVLAQRINSAGVVQWTADGVVICNADNQQQSVEIISDGLGGAIITWEDLRGGSTFDIYTQRVNSTGDVKWTANGTAICTAANHQTNPYLVSDGAGGAIITWIDERVTPGSWDAYAQRINSTGDVKWTADGVAICTIGGSYPKLVSDGAGGAIIAWYDGRELLEFDIYAQRINSVGNTLWTDNGTLISNYTNWQYRPEIVSDGSGGAIILWKDQRSDTGDIYAQKINSAGTTQWTDNGTAICTATGAQDWIDIASDGAGGAIATWQDERNGNWDVYAQRISSTGAVNWTTKDGTICNATGDQLYPELVGNGSGGAIIVWDDPRSGDLDIYAQRAPILLGPIGGNGGNGDGDDEPAIPAIPAIPGYNLMVIGIISAISFLSVGILLYRNKKLRV